MKLRYTLIVLVAMLATTFGAVAAQHNPGTPDAGHDMDHGEHNEHGENLSMAAFYFTVTNNGDDSEQLVMVETDMAEIVEIHNVEMKDGVMQMTPMHDGLGIPAGESIVLEPGGYHVMMIGITESLLDGEEFDATLHFEHAGEVEVTVPIFAFEPDEDELGDAVESGDIEVSNVWARQAPKLDGMATPMATPDATPGH